MFYWLLKWVVLGPLLKLVFRPQAEGTEHVPDDGPAILASNHLSYSDWLFMPLTIPRRVTFVAKAEYFTGTGVKGWLQKTFFSGAGQVPIDRSERPRRRGRDPRPGCASWPRASCSASTPRAPARHDGRLYRGKTGVARMALEAKVPVIPVAVVGTDVVAPPGQDLRPVRPARASASASRWTSRATRGWRTTASSCARSPTRSCTRS